MTIDLRDQNTEADFHALTRGLFIAAQENGYLPYLRRLVSHSPWGERVKHYIYVEGRAEFTITNYGITGEFRTILAATVSDAGPDETYFSGVTVTVPFNTVVEVDKRYVGHTDEEGACVDMEHLDQVVRADLREKMAVPIADAQVTGVRLAKDSVRPLCLHPLHT